MTTKIEITDDMVERFKKFLSDVSARNIVGQPLRPDDELVRIWILKIIDPQPPAIGDLIANVTMCKNVLLERQASYLAVKGLPSSADRLRAFDHAGAEFTEALNAVRDRMIELSGEKE